MNLVVHKIIDNERNCINIKQLTKEVLLEETQPHTSNWFNIFLYFLIISQIWKTIFNEMQ